MQEEIQNKTVTLSIQTTKLTARTLANALKKFIAYSKNKSNIEKNKDVIPHGKQSLKELSAQNQGLSNIVINNKNIKSFDRVARKYGVDYALKKDKTTTPPKYLVFFKAKDADALTAAFREYTAKELKKQAKVPVVQKLKAIAEKIMSVPSKIKNKEHDAR